MADSKLPGRNDNAQRNPDPSLLRDLASRPRNWVILGASLLLAVWSAVSSFSVIAQGSNPAVAAAINGSLPRAAAQMGDLNLVMLRQKSLPPGLLEKLRQGGVDASGVMLGGGGMELSPTERADVRGKALGVLRMSAYSSAGLRQLAAAEQDPAKRERYLRLANEVSRRDVMSTLQMAEVDIQAGKVAEGLGGFNRALIVSTRLDATVFPLLAGAAADPTMAEQIGTLLERDPIWADRLMRWAIANPASVPALSGVLHYIPATSIAHADGYGQQFIDLLATQNRYAEAFDVYEAYAAGGQDIGNLTGAMFPPIDWRLIDNYDTGSRPFNENQIEIFANPGRIGSFAEIITPLTPGTYTFSYQLADALGTDASLRLAVECVDGAERASIAAASVPLANGTRRINFNVPADGCDFQHLSLAVEASADAAGALLSNASLAPANRPAAR